MPGISDQSLIRKLKQAYYAAGNTCTFYTIPAFPYQPPEYPEGWLGKFNGPPPSYEEGDFWYDLNTHLFMGYNGTHVIEL